MPKGKLDNRRDLLLLLLYSPGVGNSFNEPIIGRTRIVKMLFIFRQEILSEFKKDTALSEENFYEFFPWKFGPFSTQVYDDLTFFSLRGFIDTEDSSEVEETLPESAEEWEEWLSSSQGSRENDGFVDYEEKEFRLTEHGVEFTQELYACLTGNQQKILRDFKKRLCKAPLRAILRYVYKTYPEQTQKSTIKEQVMETA